MSLFRLLVTWFQVLDDRVARPNFPKLVEKILILLIGNLHCRLVIDVPWARADVQVTL